MKKNFTLKIIVIFVIIQTAFAPFLPLVRASKTEVRTIGTVPSFGTYSFRGYINFNVPKPGKFEIGKITIFGTYNGPYPWIMRIYTDNTNLMPVAGSLGTQNKGGLISQDGQFTIPLEINCPNFGKDVWVAIPDINNEDYKPYRPAREVGIGNHTDCIIMAIDPRNADWVSGPDRTLFTGDDNPLGDTTIATPFDVRFAAYFDQRSIKGNYTSNIYIELVPAP